MKRLYLQVLLDYLDIYKKGGDSLMGRYFMYRFHPLSAIELLSTDLPKREIRKPELVLQDHWEHLWTFGEYPDPFLNHNMRFFNNQRSYTHSKSSQYALRQQGLLF